MPRSLRSLSWIIRLSALLSFVPKSFGFFHSYRSLRCYEFRASPSLYRKSASWISFSLVAVVDFATLPSTSHSLTGLAPFSRVVRPEIRRNDEERRRGNPQHNPAIYYKFPVELFLSSSSCLISTL